MVDPLHDGWSFGYESIKSSAEKSSLQDVFQRGLLNMWNVLLLHCFEIWNLLSWKMYLAAVSSIFRKAIKTDFFNLAFDFRTTSAFMYFNYVDVNVMVFVLFLLAILVILLAKRQNWKQKKNLPNVIVFIIANQHYPWVNTWSSIFAIFAFDYSKSKQLP